MRDDELQMKAQSSLQEFNDAVERLDPNYEELGRRSLAALDEFIEFWENHPEAPKSREGVEDPAAPEALEDGNEMRRFVARQLEWGESQKERVRSHLPKKG